MCPRQERSQADPCSRESEASTSDSTGRGSRQSGSANATGTPATSSESTGREYRSTRTSPSSEVATLSTWTSSTEDSPARTYPRRVSEKVSKAPAPRSTANCGEWFARWDQTTSSWRTPQASLTSEPTTFSLRWPMAGMMRNGRCYRRPVLGLAKDVIDYLSSASGEGGGDSHVPDPRLCGLQMRQEGERELETARKEREALGSDPRAVPHADRACGSRETFAKGNNSLWGGAH